jgi:hypothetical protein
MAATTGVGLGVVSQVYAGITAYSAIRTAMAEKRQKHPATNRTYRFRTTI